MASEVAPRNSPVTGERMLFEHYGSTVVVQGLTLGFGILTGILTARMLGPVGRGEYAAIIIWPTAIVACLPSG